MTDRPFRPFRVAAWLALAVTVGLAELAVPPLVRAEIELPPGFQARVYVTGEGFGPPDSPRGRGIPTTTTLTVDHTGALYLARAGRRYSGGEFEYLSCLYRIPVGGARLTPATEARFFHGPPLINAQVGGARDGHTLLVTTFDRDRHVGVLYRLDGGGTRFLAGGTPGEPTLPPLLVQPEGTAVNAAGHVYVADRDRGLVIRLDASGQALDNVRVLRPRVLAIDEGDNLWIGADGNAEAPWQAGPGEIWHVSPSGERRLVLEGPLAQGLAVGPAGLVYVADRQGGEIFALTAESATPAAAGRVGFARFTDGDAPRGIAFVPDNAETRAAGLAGSLFVVVIRSGVFGLNEIVRISGPFNDPTRLRAR